MPNWYDARRMAGENLDARLLRFRSDPGMEDAGALAAALLGAERAREALEVAGVHLRVNPRDATMLVLAGRAWMVRGDLLRAQKTLLQAARARSNDPEPYRWLGEVLLRRGDPERAEKVLSRARKLGAAGSDVERLHQRAERLARIAGGSETEEEPTLTAPISTETGHGGAFSEQEEATVVAADLSRRLAEAAVQEPSPAPAVDDDAPTTTLDRGLVDAAMRAEKAERRVPVSPPVAPVGDLFDDATKLARPRPRGVPPAAAPPAAAPPPAAPSVEPSVSGPEPFQASVAGLSEGSRGDEAFASRSEVQTSLDAPPAGTSSGATPAALSATTPATPEDVDRVMAMLQREHLFEPPDDAATEWVATKAAGRSGQKLAVPLAVLWVVALLVAGGGYFGYTKWVEAQEAEAAAMVQRAEAHALRGDHKDLVDAERLVREARELHPLDEQGPSVLLFVHAQRALEDGAFEPGYLRPTLEFARGRGASEARLSAAEAILAYASGKPDEGRSKLEGALAQAGEDAIVFYVVGRLQQRLGEDDAIEHLEKALEKEPGLSAAAIALAEAKADDGQLDEGIALLDGIVARYEGHLRATLWKAYLSADDREPEAAMAALAPMDERLDEAAPTDKVLLALTRARLYRRQGDAEAAAQQVEKALEAGASEPRMQALVATSARALGQLSRAQTAAMSAVSGAPGIAEYRKLLAEILVERRDGVRALRVLGELSSDDPDVLLLSTRAALLVGDHETLRATAQALDEYLEANPDEPSVTLKALRLRVAVKLGEARQVLARARRMARNNPGVPEVGLAVAEAALAAHEPALARRALEGAIAAEADNAEAHYLLGRTARMAGDAQEAEASLRRALELQPTHTEAQVALGRLLLDRGDYGGADVLFSELARRVGRSGSGRTYALVGRLGRVEALMGLGRVEDAKVQLENIAERDRGLAMVKVVEARVALADGRPGDAIRTLRPIAVAEGANADVLALFGDALYAVNEPLAATEQYERALALDEGHPEALLGFARVLIRGGKLREARGIIDRAEGALGRRIRPPVMMARVLALRGRVALEEREEAAARRLLRQATEIEGAPAEAWFYLGEALAGDDSPGARRAYETYLEMAPAGPLARRARRAIR